MPNLPKWSSLPQVFEEAENKTDSYTEYAVRDSDAVTLSLVFGTTGVAANTTIRIMKQKLVEDVAGDIKELALGTGEALLGKTLVCYSLLTRTAAMGNSKTLKVHLKVTGGPKDYSLSLKQEAAANESAMFRMEILFI